MDDADVYALLDEVRGRRVPGVAEAAVMDVGLLEDGLPLAPVLGTADRVTVVLAEREIACHRFCCRGTGRSAQGRVATMLRRGRAAA